MIFGTTLDRLATRNTAGSRLGAWEEARYCEPLGGRCRGLQTHREDYGRVVCEAPDWSVLSPSVSSYVALCFLFRNLAIPLLKTGEYEIGGYFKRYDNSCSKTHGVGPDMSIELRGKERSGLRRSGMINRYNGLASITQPNVVLFEFENYECFSEFRRLASSHEHRDCSDQE
jgi:hypothetical protein